MGQEIDSHHFTDDDFCAFAENLRAETDLLGELFAEHAFSNRHGVGGFELEAWLVDKQHKPASINERFLTELGDPLVCSELANFNIELNSDPERLDGAALSVMHEKLECTWRNCVRQANDLDTAVVMIGILPTVGADDLVPDNMSKMKRYRALNDQVMERRKGKPIDIEINGADRLSIEHESVMLEAATTALQIQLQVDFDQSVRFYNSSIILSAPILALSANSPFLFGKQLWDETRIPVFEQSLANLQSNETAGRVSLGRCYAGDSLFDIFANNTKYYEPLLPMVFDRAPDQFCHLRLHNGTIWRWNRPLVGMSDDGSYHLRIEHRVNPAGPTVADVMANAAFFFGLIETMGRAETAPESMLSFAQAEENFYNAARDGLDARIVWLNGKHAPVRELLQKELIPAARDGLVKLGLNSIDINRYIGIIKQRAQSSMTGATWQKQYQAKHNCSMTELCSAYMERQATGAPVGEWRL